MIIRIKVSEQTLSIVNTKSVPRKGSKEYLLLQFLFSSDWNDLDKVCYLQKGDVSQPIDVVEGIVEVPEWFTEQDSFDVTLFGTNGGQEVPTNVVALQLEKSNTLWQQDAPEPQNSWFVQVIDAKNDALAAAIRAENAAIHQPYPNEETSTWWVWNAEAGAYKDSGVSYKTTGESGGKGLVVDLRGYILTVEGTTIEDMSYDPIYEATAAGQNVVFLVKVESKEAFMYPLISMVVQGTGFYVVCPEFKIIFTNGSYHSV